MIYRIDTLNVNSDVLSYIANGDLTSLSIVDGGDKIEELKEMEAAAMARWIQASRKDKPDAYEEWVAIQIEINDACASEKS